MKNRIHITILLVMSFLLNRQVYAQSSALETTGDILLFALPATALSSSLFAKDYKGTWQFAKGFTLNQAITIGLKHAINKKRPYDNGVRAFPSGHTSTTFQSAAFLQKRYGWKYGILAYALASFTGYSRIYAKRHDSWDVLAGAIVGIGSAYLFTSTYQRKHMQLTFYKDENSFALGFKFRF